MNDNILIQNYGGLCNNLINLLSSIRITNHHNYNALIYKDNNLNSLFDLSELNYEEKCNDKKTITRSHWRFSVFDTDKNLEKIVDNEFSLMFQDFNEHIFFKNYKNNCIDFIYKPELFHEIYQDYASIFNKLIIKEDILNKIEIFTKLFFNKHTISVHLRSWVDCNGRTKYFDINKFYNKIEEYNNGINTFFVSSDNKNICYDIKKKFGNNIIIYNPPSNEQSLITALVELVLLSKNNILFGSFISTFTELSYIINYNINKKIYII